MKSHDTKNELKKGTWIGGTIYTVPFTEEGKQKWLKVCVAHNHNPSAKVLEVTSIFLNENAHQSVHL